MFAKAVSINFIVRTDAFEEDGIRAFMFHELEDDPQVVARAARPRGGELAFQLVGLERRMKRVFGQQLERELQFRGELRMLRAKRRAERTKAVDGSSRRFTRGFYA